MPKKLFCLLLVCYKVSKNNIHVPKNAGMTSFYTAILRGTTLEYVQAGSFHEKLSSIPHTDEAVLGGAEREGKLYAWSLSKPCVQCITYFFSVTIVKTLSAALTREKLLKWCWRWSSRMMEFTLTLR